MHTVHNDVMLGGRTGIFFVNFIVSVPVNGFNSISFPLTQVTLPHLQEAERPTGVMNSTLTVNTLHIITALQPQAV